MYNCLHTSAKQQLWQFKRLTFSMHHLRTNSIVLEPFTNFGHTLERIEKNWCERTSVFLSNLHRHSGSPVLLPRVESASLSAYTSFCRLLFFSCQSTSKNSHTAIWLIESHPVSQSKPRCYQASILITLCSLNTATFQRGSGLSFLYWSFFSVRFKEAKSWRWTERSSRHQHRRAHLLGAGGRVTGLIRAGRNLQRSRFCQRSVDVLAWHVFSQQDVDRNQI